MSDRVIQAEFRELLDKVAELEQENAVWRAEVEHERDDIRTMRDYIIEIRRENATLRAALEPFAAYPVDPEMAKRDAYIVKSQDSTRADGGIGIKVQAILDARAALHPTKERE